MPPTQTRDFGLDVAITEQRLPIADPSLLPSKLATGGTSTRAHQPEAGCWPLSAPRRAAPPMRLSTPTPGLGPSPSRRRHRDCQWARACAEPLPHKSALSERGIRGIRVPAQTGPQSPIC